MTQRINVVGTSASGKTTFSKALAQKMAVPHIEMDALNWQSNWEACTFEELLIKLKQCLAADSWILDGNYSKTTPVKWQNVDMVIWLDYGFGRNLYQSVSRTIRRLMSGTPLWEGTNNIESFQRAFLSGDSSIIWWMIKTHGKNQRKYQHIMANPEFAHIRFVRLTSPKQARQFLQQFNACYFLFKSDKN
ncbi:P-loop NTPase family protein [Alkanindiges illinoisensis]|uniref:adenylate kinase n=1 Tax=Alkanindiges illinoisensis TaxID=197183 RepID=UPI0006889B28|nr:adenylate kinase [Alkanindiges illinoisensis]